MPTLPELLNPGFDSGSGYHRNQWGYLEDDQGNLAPGQQTPGSNNFTPVDAKGNFSAANIPSQFIDPTWTTTGTQSAVPGVPGSPFLPTGAPGQVGGPTGSPGPTGNPSAPGGSGSAYSSTGFQFPTFNAPRYTPGAGFGAPPPFSYKDFSAPSIEDARNEPGFAFALDEGQKALQNSAAHKGTVRSGGAEKGLASWVNQFADQNYGNVFNRTANIYSTNRNNAADAYATNYGISRDVWDRNTRLGQDTYDRNFNAAAAEFNPLFQASQLKFADLFNRQQLNQNTLTQLAGYGAV